MAKPSSPIRFARETLARFDAERPHTAGRVRQVIGGVLIADGLVGLENPLDGKKTRPGLLVNLAAAIFMSLFFGMFYSVTSSIEDQPTGAYDVATQGRVFAAEPLDDPSTCGGYLTYTADGVEYEWFDIYQKGTAASCAETIGRTVDVAYQSDDPAEARIGPADPVVDQTIPPLFFWSFVGVPLLLAVIAWAAVLPRVAAIVAGWLIIRSGTRMIDENPASAADEALVAQAKEMFTNALVAARAHGRKAAAAVTGTRTATPVAPAVAPRIGPGWYATADGTSERWHDGTRWTEHARPIAGTAPGR